MSLDIPRVTLDPQQDEEMIAQAYERIQAASDNLITDFSPSSPVAALVEGQVFVVAELLWYLNQLPTALALEVLRLSGVSRNAGTKARGQLNFLLSSPLASDFLVSSGFVVPYKDAGYATVDTLIIPAGSLEGSVAVEAMVEGKVYNAPAFAVSGSSTGLSYLQSIYNPDPITGGSDLEPIEETIRRSQLALRTRNTLVTIEDYENKASELLGFGSRATAYPLISSDRHTEVAGNVHVFAVDSIGKPPSAVTCSSVQQALKALSFAGSSVWVSPVELVQVNIETVLRVPNVSQAIADNIYKALFDYLSPLQFPLGGSIRIKELEYLVRSVDSVLEVTTLLINSQAVNLPMANRYTTPELDVVTVSLVDDLGRSHSYFLGVTDGDRN